MANTYTQLSEHVVFSTRNRNRVIREEFRERLEQYMSGIIRNCGQKLLAIYCMPDHCHILIGRDTDCPVSDIVNKIKTKSSKWINENKLVRGKFHWQTGYGAFSVCGSAQKDVINYIRNQPEHHRSSSFAEEYIKLLDKEGVDFDPRYLLG